MGIKITADRMIDLTNEELASLNVSTISCFINMGSVSYSDLDDVFPDDVFNFVAKTGIMPKTAARSPDAYYDFFEPFVNSGDTVLHFAASSGISSICSHAKIAAERFAGKVFVVDTLSLSGAIAILVKTAVKMIEEGETDTSKIAIKCSQIIPSINSSFLIEDLSFLHKGGRCSTLSYYAANLLKIKPIIYLAKDGKMTVREKIRGKSEQALQNYIKRTLAAQPPVEDEIYFSLTSPSEQVQNYILSILEQLNYSFKKIFFNKCGCNCCVHSGRNAVGMFYINA